MRTDAEREYDRQWQARRRVEQPERVAANRQRWLAKNPYHPVDPDLKRARYSAAAKLRWAKGARARELQGDLKLLEKVMISIRRRLEAKERKRVEAREFWRANADRLNAKRRKGRSPERHDFFTACRRFAKTLRGRRVELEIAMQRVNKRITTKLRRGLRRRYEKAIRRLKKPDSVSRTAREMVGCSLDQLRLHLERLWQPGMSWANYGYHGWHIDHIRPIAAFDLTQEDQRRQCFHFSNLQPLWKDQNFAKRNREI